MISPHEPVAGGSVPLDVDLIRRHSIAGPRYTSYPPATKFTTDLETLGLEEAVADDNQAGASNGEAGGKRPISLYFHLPFCETRCWFCGCNTVITRRRASAAEYLDDLAREMRLTAAQMDRSRVVTQIHLGGGTPTFFPPDELRRLGALIREIFPHRAPDCEFGVEVDPRRLTEEHVRALHEIGANRASLGVQDTNPQVQLAIHRIQPQRMNEAAFAWLRAAGFDSINVDLIYGLPFQTPQSFSRTIDDVLSLRPDRLSIFSYAHVPWIKPAQKIFDDRNQLPDAEAKLGMFAVAHERLTAAGFIDIGLDHFARPDDSLAVAQRAGTLHRNFQGYTTQAGASLYSFGISAISSTPDSYRQNFKTLPEWRAALDAGRLPIERGLRLTEEDQRRRTVIMRLMCDRRLGFARMTLLLGVPFAENYAAEIASLDDLVADGLVVRTEEGIEVTRAGVPLLRVVAMRFDPTLSAGGREHSRTI
ncbi:MAG TPA: oxygen-independent coproporphyrinogen III oxidase [Opitutaceae bacterium]|nr:oxygen-independent coproporphyrinogen III oxidase [Opitutaceae bacterium]